MKLTKLLFLSLTLVCSSIMSAQNYHKEDLGYGTWSKSWFADEFGDPMYDKPYIQTELRKKYSQETFDYFYIRFLLYNGQPAYEIIISHYGVTGHSNYDLYGDEPMDNITFTCLNVVNPDATPPGTSHFALTTGFITDAWDKVPPEDYNRVKRRIAEKMLDRYEEVMGIDIRSHIEEVSIATPVTFARYLGTPQGSVYGYHSSYWDGMSARTLVGGREQTVPGLFFVGAHANRLSGFFPTLSLGDITGRQVMGYVMAGGKGSGAAPRQGHGQGTRELAVGASAPEAGGKPSNPQKGGKQS